MVDLSTRAIRADHRHRAELIKYSICTLVTRAHEYVEMIESFRLRGFREPDCEFLYLDNTQNNSFESYAGYNLFLNVARGEFIILCHQDILLLEDGRTKLDGLLDELTTRDSRWGVCGNGGGGYPGHLAIRISDPHGENQRTGTYPAKVTALDENFIIVRRTANLALSHNLAGYHFYGADICIIADILGWNSYVIDFHLRHKSPGFSDQAFQFIKTNIIRKYRLALRSRWIQTTCALFFVSGIPGLGYLLSTRLTTRIARFLGRRFGGE